MTTRPPWWVPDTVGAVFLATSNAELDSRHCAIGAPCSCCVSPLSVVCCVWRPGCNQSKAQSHRGTGHAKVRSRTCNPDAKFWSLQPPHQLTVRASNWRCLNSHGVTGAAAHAFSPCSYYSHCHRVADPVRLPLQMLLHGGSTTVAITSAHLLNEISAKQLFFKDTYVYQNQSSSMLFWSQNFCVMLWKSFVC